MRACDWSATPLGPRADWPETLKIATSMMLESPFPQAIAWGPRRLTLYNDAFIPILGGKHPVHGEPFEIIWAEAWDTIGPILDAAMRGEATFIEDFPLVVERGKGAEQAFFTFSYSPIRDASGRVLGVLDTVMETTQTVQAMQHRRRLTFLDDLNRAVQQASSASAILAVTTRMVAEHLDLFDCAYADMDPDSDGFTIRGDWVAPGGKSIVGHYRLADFGALAVEKLSAGAPLVVDDVVAELAPDEAATFQSIGIAATICMPLVKDGRLTALMAIHAATPRHWTDYELSLIREVTERSWAHVERVRAEDEVERAQEAGGVGLFTLDIETGMIHGSPGFRTIFGLDPSGPLVATEIEKMVLREDVHIASDPERRRRGDAKLDVEYRITRPDGEVRAIARRAEYERDATGRVVRMLGAVRDITEQRAAQRALQESEALFRTLTETMPDMVWTAPATGFPDWFNDRVYLYSGIPHGALDGEAWMRMVHADDIAIARNLWHNAVSTGEAYEAEFRLRRADGAYRWHLSRSYPIHDDKGAISRWVGTNTDIHERVLSEAASERDRERMWVMTQDLLISIGMDAVIIDVNPTAMRLLGWDPEEMIGRPILDFIHPEDHAATAAEVTKISGGATALAFENRYRTKSGAYRLLDWTAVPDNDRIFGVARDITDSRSIARDQERIWSLSPVLKLVASPDGTIQKVNPAWTEALGWAPRELVGRSLLDLVAEADRDRAGAALERSVLGEAMGEQEYALAAKDGDTRQVAWTFVIESGSLFGFGRDITDQRSAEDALRQAQKMEAVGQLTGGIAHDFNNLLQGVSGNLELLKHRIAQGRTDGLDRFITGAATSASRCAALTHRLLAFSRRQPLDPRPVRANPLVRSMEDMLRRTLSETVDLELVLAGGLWLTRCDPNQLESAILNLAINARDAMPGGGRLTIETCNTHLDAAYAARNRDVEAGQYVCIAVTDTGVGMEPTTISRAFEPFFTTKPIGQGTGLGLSMIYGFARQSEGHAAIYSEAGKGTTVKIYLPRHRGEAAEDEEVPQLGAGHATDSGETVLVVEDEPVVRGLIVEVLSELGYRAIEAFDGPSGVDILRSKRRIDLLVTDIGLPGLNGRQVADAGRAARPDLKVLFMTGYAENAALASGFLEHGMAMITKPFAMEALASRIREMIEA